MLNPGEFCDECGTGVVDSSPTGSVLRLPDDYPFNKECESCKERAKQSIQKFAANAYISANKAVFDKLLGTR